MFGDVATQLIKLMGRRETVPSAIEPEDIPEALRQLGMGLANQDETNTEGEADRLVSEEIETEMATIICERIRDAWEAEPLSLRGSG